MIRALAARLRAFGTDRRASSAVEFALVAPVLLLMLAGAIDYGRAFTIQRGLIAAAQAAAEYAFQAGALSGNESQIADFARQAAGSPDDLDVQVSQVCRCPNGTEVACGQTCSGTQPIEYASVSLNLPIETIAWTPFWTGSRTLSAQMSVRLP